VSGTDFIRRPFTAFNDPKSSPFQTPNGLLKPLNDEIKGNPRVVLGTGDQVGRETPEENIVAMIEEAKKC